MVSSLLPDWHIVLSSEQAAQVRGKSPPFAALEPVAVNDGRFVLPVAVLEDPAHAKDIPFLATLPQALLRFTNSGSLTIAKSTERAADTTGILNPTYNPPKGKQAWEVPPLPEKGDWSESGLFEAIGRALSAWERFEHSLADLYMAFLSPHVGGLPAYRAYGSIITAKGRLEMIQVAGRAYFSTSPDAKGETGLKQIIKLASDYGPRRNELAHGIVGPYSSPAGHVRGVALHPSDYATNKQILRGGLEIETMWGPRATIPRYAYTSAEVKFFTRKFGELLKPSHDLFRRTFRFFRENPDVVPEAKPKTF
jgi:hypothetical protein